MTGVFKPRTAGFKLGVLGVLVAVILAVTAPLPPTAPIKKLPRAAVQQRGEHQL